MSEKIGFQFFNKPPGIATHRPSEEDLGFVEWCQLQKNKEFRVCHRLDKDTSGAIVFAESKEMAAHLTELFTQRHVEKEYLFISDKKSREETWIVREEKAKGTLGGERPKQEGIGVTESLTEFKRTGVFNSLYLYTAKPRTGKTHQIRKHAIRSGVPILGDTLYGGSDFPRLMLHSHKLQFKLNETEHTFTAKTSRLFQNSELCQDDQLCRWIVGVERRESLFPEQFHSKEQCLRLLHTESEDLRIDKAGPRWILGWWKKESPNKAEEKRIEKLMALFNQQDWIFEWRPGVNEKEKPEIVKQGQAFTSQDWEFKEGESLYRGSLDRGHNFGLFLDQRDRRRWVLENATGKSVLNLFAFTCGFSLCAARGGASEVVSVDTFKKYLEWGKENFTLNDLKPENYQFRCMDSLEYLEYAKKKGLKFDIVVCDPPSFSRAKKKKKVFRVERDYKSLIQACSDVLSAKGTLLFSTNYEKDDLKKWTKKVKEVAEESGFREIIISPSQWDYEWKSREANLKAFFLKKA